MSLGEVAPNELVVTFSVNWNGGEMDEDSVQLDRVPGLQPRDLREVERDLDANVRVGPGSVGVGAAGPGIELIIAYLSIPADVLALTQIGRGLLEVIRRVRARRERRVVVSHGPTLAALATAQLPPQAATAMAGMRYASCRNLSGLEPPNWVGTDDRHVWMVTFEHPTDGTMGVVFMSPSATVLGWNVIPVAIYYNGDDWVSRSPDDVEKWTPPV